MHVLMAESSSNAGRQVASALREAGHAVSTCRSPSDGGVECEALRDGGTCPLENLPIDLFVLVRSEEGGGVCSERGALCAAGRRIPLVVAGDVGDNPYRQWTAVERLGTHVVAVAERVVERPLPRHSQAAREAVEAAVDSSASCSAEVYRVAGGLNAVVSAVPAPPPETRAAAVTRVHQSLRALDPWARYVDVSFAS